MPNPLRCFNCQKFGHHENNCPVDLVFVCANCGAGGHDHHTSPVKNKPKCVNCGKDHVSRSSECKIWKKEKTIIKGNEKYNIFGSKKTIRKSNVRVRFNKNCTVSFFQPRIKNNRNSIFRNRLQHSSIIKSYYSLSKTKVSAKTYFSISISGQFSVSIKF